MFKNKNYQLSGNEPGTDILQYFPFLYRYLSFPRQAGSSLTLGLLYG